MEKTKLTTMFNRKTIIVHGVFGCLYLILATIYVYQIINPELHFFAKQPPFQVTKLFFIPFLEYPGGLAEYFSLFLYQSFCFKMLGTLCIISMSVLLYIAIYKSFYIKESNWNLFLLAFIPVILAISLLNNYYFSYVSFINILFVYITFAISISFIKNNKNTFIIYFIASSLLYYIVGGSSFILYSASFLISLFSFYNFKNVRFQIISIIVFTVLLPYISYKFVFHIPLSKSFFEYYPSNDLVLQKYNRNIYFYMFYFSAPIISLISLVLNKIQHSEKDKTDDISWYKKHSYILVFGIIVLLSFISTKANVSKHENTLLKTDYYCVNEEWEKAVSEIQSDSEYDIILNFYYNRAIDNMGMYLDKFFDYPQKIGTYGIFPDQLNYQMQFMFYSDYYYDLGYISISQQWAFKYLSKYQYSPRVLERLVLTNLIIRDYKIAGKMLAILDKNLISKDFVEKYSAYIQDTTLIDNDPILSKKRGEMPINMLTPITIEDRLLDLLDKNKQNKSAYEHLQINYLLDHNLGGFLHNLPQTGLYYSTLPTVFEQALFILSTKQKFDFSQYKVRKSTYEEFKDFWGIYSTYGNNKQTAQAKLKNYRNTLYYYILFESPKVTKSKPIIMSSDGYNN